MAHFDRLRRYELRPSGIGSIGTTGRQAHCGGAPNPRQYQGLPAHLNNYELSPDTSWWINHDEARYYGVGSIRVRRVNASRVLRPRPRWTHNADCLRQAAGTIQECSQRQLKSEARRQKTRSFGAPHEFVRLYDNDLDLRGRAEPLAPV